MDIRRRLGDLLVESGMITPEQLEKALNEQRRTGERLGKILTRLGYVREKDILEVLEFQLGIPKVVLEDYQLDPEVVRTIPEALARRYMAVPIRKDGNRLLVAMADPLNLNAIDDLRLASGMEIVPAIASEKEIEAALGRFFEPRIDEDAISALEEIKVDVAASWDTYDLDEPAAGGIDRAPVVQLVNQLITKAVRSKASDIHIEPQESHIAIRYRIDGLLREVLRLPPGVLNSLVSRIKIMAGMDIAEKRLPQDGRFQITLERRSVDLRVSTMPTVYGEKIVLRILDKANMLLNLDKLGFLPETLEQYESLIRSSYGMILITGPTGSGKTTTLYATLNALNTPEKNIITIEDPVEYLLPGINQVRVNPKAGLDFARGLRAILRQDPDIIMVGEIRDRETADIAVRAATTGHLVFSTLHTNDAAGAVTRLLDMGIEPFLVNSSLLGVVAQRLVRLVCPQCREPHEPKPGDIEYEFTDEERKIFYRGKGCRQCNYTGYQGRTAIHEILVMTDDIRHLVSQKVHVSKIREAAIAGGMVTLRDDGLSKAAKGLTTVQEVLRVTISGF
ncbi:MAG: type pilus assembly protein PilB [Tepidanaerobacteraceae bacterium]|nr:type pilus assembly protein PilB [Tepidanaerobacteraceae bacterium]